MQMLDILLKYILWHEFLNDFDAQSDFDKHFVTEKPVNQNHSYLKYALDVQNFWDFPYHRLATQKHASALLHTSEIHQKIDYL